MTPLPCPSDLCETSLGQSVENLVTTTRAIGTRVASVCRLFGMYIIVAKRCVLETKSYY